MGEPTSSNISATLIRGRFRSEGIKTEFDNFFTNNLYFHDVVKRLYDTPRWVNEYQLKVSKK
jgi:hypothetical protein